MSQTVPVVLGEIRGGSDRLASAVRNVPVDRYVKGRMSDAAAPTDRGESWRADYSGAALFPEFTREDYVQGDPAASGVINTN